jgi:hypothetical protein
MPSLAIHIKQAEFFEEAALYNQENYPPVTIIMCFYAALHYVEAYAAWRKDDIYARYADVWIEQDSCSNETKLRRLTQHERYENYVHDIGVEVDSEDLFAAYKRLHRASNTARYLKHIKEKDRTAVQHFKGAKFYIERLQMVKSALQISLIKASIESY